jgi:hypothetical protein
LIWVFNVIVVLLLSEEFAEEECVVIILEEVLEVNAIVGLVGVLNIVAGGTLLEVIGNRPNQFLPIVIIIVAFTLKPGCLNQLVILLFP